MAVAIITSAAQAAGMDPDRVKDKAVMAEAMQAVPRLELTYLPERLDKGYRRFPGAPVPDQPSRRRTRAKTYARTLTVVATAVDEDEARLEAFGKAFLAALPRKTADAGNNLVTVSATAADWGGFGQDKLVEVFKRRSLAFHVAVTGMVTVDTDEDMITDVAITPNYQEAQSGS
jgi:hypothetical protein